MTHSDNDPAAQPVEGDPPVGDVSRMVSGSTRPHRRSTDPGVDGRRPARATRDRQRLRAAALGDASAWEALVEAHAATVWSACLRCGLRPEDAAAVSELVWLCLLDALPDLEAPLETWLLATTAHEAQRALVRTGGAASAFAGAGGDRRRSSRDASSVG